jgi:hypothetical protein
VTIITFGHGRDMIQWFAVGSDTIVTTGTTTQHLEVIHLGYGRPVYSRVTVFAEFRCDDMRRIFAFGPYIIVATNAALGDATATVFKGGGQPAVRVVAIITGIFTGNMVEVLAGCGDAIMAAIAAAQHLEMINADHRLPGTGGVTIRANFGGTDMGWVFTS